MAKNMFNEKFWYLIVIIMCMFMIVMVKVFGSDLDAAELPDETEPVIIEQPKKQVSPTPKKPTKKKPLPKSNKSDNSEDNIKYEEYEDYKELTA